MTRSDTAGTPTTPPPAVDHDALRLVDCELGEAGLQAKYGAAGEHPSRTRRDWGRERADGDTSLDYWAWVENLLEHDTDPWPRCARCGAYTTYGACPTHGLAVSAQ